MRMLYGNYKTANNQNKKNNNNKKKKVANYFLTSVKLNLNLSKIKAK